MEHSHCHEADSSLASQEILCILWDSKLHYGDHKSPSLVPILCQIFSVHAIPSSVFKKHLNIPAHPNNSQDANFYNGDPHLSRRWQTTPCQLSATAYCYVSYLEAVYSVRNLRTRVVVVTGADLTWQQS
jgi:hypothetical protein